MVVLGIPYSTFINNVLHQVKPVDFHTGVLKGAIFGLLIGIIACGNGLKVTGGAAGVAGVLDMRVRLVEPWRGRRDARRVRRDARFSKC